MWERPSSHQHGRSITGWTSSQFLSPLSIASLECKKTTKEQIAAVVTGGTQPWFWKKKVERSEEQGNSLVSSLSISSPTFLRQLESEFTGRYGDRLFSLRHVWPLWCDDIARSSRYSIASFRLRFDAGRVAFPFHRRSIVPIVCWPTMQMSRHFPSSSWKVNAFGLEETPDQIWHFPHWTTNDWRHTSYANKVHICS